MGAPAGFSEGLALFLADCCFQAYNKPGLKNVSSIPAGYTLVDSIIAAPKNILDFYGFIIESPESIVISFRGSRTNPDWIADLTALQTDFPYLRTKHKIHSGFSAIYTSCRQQIMNILSALNSSKQLFITGHSLGGALAVLCALDTASNTAFKSPVMYNFGSPRVGSPKFAEVYNEVVEDSMRIVNTNDIVTMLPPAVIQPPLSNDIIYYRHVNNLVAISSPTGGMVKDHFMESYIAGLRGIYDKQ